MTSLHYAGLALAIALAGCALLEYAEPSIITGGESPTLIPDVPFVVSARPVVEAMLLSTSGSCPPASRSGRAGWRASEDLRPR